MANFRKVLNDYNTRFDAETGLLMLMGLFCGLCQVSQGEQLASGTSAIGPETSGRVPKSVHDCSDPYRDGHHSL